MTSADFYPQLPKQKTKAKAAITAIINAAKGNFVVLLVFLPHFYTRYFKNK